MSTSPSGPRGLEKRNQEKKEICQSENPEQELLSEESRTNELSRSETNVEQQSTNNWTKVAIWIAILSFLAAFTCHLMTENYSGYENQRDAETTIPKNNLMGDLILENLPFPEMREKRKCGTSSEKNYSACVLELMDKIKAKIKFLKLKNSTVSSTDYKRAVEKSLKKFVSHSLAIDNITLNHENFKQLKDASIFASKLRLGFTNTENQENLLNIIEKATYFSHQDEKFREKISYSQNFLLKHFAQWLATELQKNKNDALIAAMANFVMIRASSAFENINGSVGRIILNYILVNRGYPWVIIPAHGVKEYQNAIKLAVEKGDLTPYLMYVLKCVLGSLDLFISDLNLKT